MIASDIGQRFQHPRANAASLQRIGDGERHFCATCCLRVADEGRDSDEAIPGFGHQDELVFLVGTKQSGHFAVGARGNPEESGSQTFPGQPVVQRR